MDATRSRPTTFLPSAVDVRRLAADPTPDPGLGELADPRIAGFLGPQQPPPRRRGHGARALPAGQALSGAGGRGAS